MIVVAHSIKRGITRSDYYEGVSDAYDYYLSSNHTKICII